MPGAMTQWIRRIRPLFRDSPDIDTMKRYGLDLSSYDDVRAKAAEIYVALKDQSMPCDEPWTEEHLALFKQWMEEGMAAGKTRPAKAPKPVKLRGGFTPTTEDIEAAIAWGRD